MTWRQAVLVAVIISLVFAGCYRPIPSGEESAVISFHGTHSVSENSVSIEGELYVEGHNPPRDIYRNVRYEFYSRNGHRLYCEDLGDLDTDGSLNISVVRQEIPHYIVFVSPDFWGERTSVEYLVRVPDTSYQYRTELVLHRSDLPNEINVENDNC